LALFLLRRLVFSVAVLLLVSLGACWFFVRHFYQPGSFIQADWWTVYTNWLHGLVDGSFGSSYLGQPLWNAYGHALMHTAILLLLAFGLVTVMSIAIGTISAVRAGSFLDLALRVLSYAAWGLPAFLLALILQRVLGLLFDAIGAHPLELSHWPGACPIPLTGGFYNGSCFAGHGFHLALQYVRHLTLPAIALATSFIGVHARYLRSSLLYALHAPYATTARAKGLTERRVVLRHALRNSLVPFTSALLLDFGSIFGAAMAVDWVFQLGGIGSVFIGAIASPTIDPNALQFLLVVTAALVLSMSLLSELAVAWLDPRVRLR
jgi:ABC-type dipeptide/oligopeptide/nickel transport system permease component